MEKPREKVTPSGATLTLPSYYSEYYSTQKARLLGEMYNHNLDRLLEKITQSPIGKLQFANSVVSISMGFFTHSASQPPDARYLEVIFGMPDILDAGTDFNAKVSRLFSQYGREILTILSSDREIAHDKKVVGYGLHFSWRSMATTPSGPRLTLEEAVLYVGKGKAKRFLEQQIGQDELLSSAVLFSRQGERPAQQVRYSPPPSQLQRQTFIEKAATVDFQAREKIQEDSGSTNGSVHGETLQTTFALPSDRSQPEKALQRAENTPPATSSQGDVVPDRLLFDPQQDSLKGQAAPAPTIEQRQPDSQLEYFVQLVFLKEAEAQQWANLLKAGGYTTAVSKKFDDDSSVRLRIGRFLSLVEATYFLQHLKDHGFQGQILRVSD